MEQIPSIDERYAGCGVARRTARPLYRKQCSMCVSRSRGPTLQQPDVDQVRPQGSLGRIHCHWNSTLRATVLGAQLSMRRPTETLTTPRASSRRASCKDVYVMASPPPPPPFFHRKVTIAGAMHRPRVGSLDTIGELIPEESNELTAGTVVDVGGVQVRTVLYGDGLGKGRPCGMPQSTLGEDASLLCPGVRTR